MISIITSDNDIDLGSTITMHKSHGVELIFFALLLQFKTILALNQRNHEMKS